MSDSTDPELARLLNTVIDAAYRDVGADRNGVDPLDEARAALLAHIAAQYVRLPPRIAGDPAEIEEALGDDYTRRGTAADDATRPPASPPGSYKAARGILPWKPGDELPEERIRRLRDDDRQHTLHLDDDGQVAGGAPDFEGER